jgi:hypothetical protein
MRINNFWYITTWRVVDIWSRSWHHRFPQDCMGSRPARRQSSDSDQSDYQNPHTLRPVRVSKPAHTNHFVTHGSRFNFILPSTTRSGKLSFLQVIRPKLCMNFSQIALTSFHVLHSQIYIRYCVSQYWTTAQNIDGTLQNTKQFLNSRTITFVYSLPQPRKEQRAVCSTGISMVTAYIIQTPPPKRARTLSFGNTRHKCVVR